MKWGKLVIGAALVLCLAGCGKKSTSEPPEVAVEPSEAVESVEITEEPVVEPTEAPEPISEPVESTEEPESLPQIYEGNELINLYLNRYNEANPEAVIESSDFEVYYHHGSEHKDQIAFTQSEVIISAKVGHKIQVVIEGLDAPEGYKEAFCRYARGYNSELEPEELDGCWSELLEKRSAAFSGAGVSLQYDYDGSIRMIDLVGVVE